MNFSFHSHAWTAYHMTEIFYLDAAYLERKLIGGRKSHIRLFEVCQVCKARRTTDLVPGEVPPLLCLEIGDGNEKR